MTVRYLFRTSGEYVAFVQDDNVFTPDCDWIGFIQNGNEVYHDGGAFMGYLLDDDRVARNRQEARRMPRMRPMRPMRPMRRLRMLRLPYPYQDVFEGD